MHKPENHGVTIDELAGAERNASFDLESGPLLRACLVTAGSRRHLLVTMPSLCSDARGLDNLVSEVARAYAAPAEASDELLQYAQFSEWQHELLDDEDAEQARQYWREQEPAAPAALSSLAATSGANGFRPTTLTRSVAAATFRRMRTVVGELDTSLDLLLLACWKTLLWRLTGQPVPVIGRLTHGRGHEALADALGLFARWLPVSTALQQDLRISDVIAQVGDAVDNGAEWEEYFTCADGIVSDGGSEPAYFPIGFGFDAAVFRCRAAKKT